MDFEIPEMPGAAASDAEPELAAPAHRCRGPQPELFAPARLRFSAESQDAIMSSAWTFHMVHGGRAG